MKTVVTLEWDYADRLRKAREVAGYNQGEMARALNISRQSVVNYERRNTEPLPLIREKWAEVCGVSEEWLVSGYGLPRRDSNLEPSDYRTTDGSINMWGLAA